MFTVIALSYSSHSAAQNSEAPKYLSDEVLIKLRSTSPSHTVIAAQNDSTKFFTKVHRTHGLHLVKSWPEMRIHHAKLDQTSGKTVEEVINDLNAMPEVEYAEPNYILKKAQSAATYTLNQVLSFNGVMTGAAIQQQQAWTTVSGASGAPVVVAIIDTGIDFSHPVFQHTVWTNPGEIPNNGIDDDGDGYVDDVHGWNFAYNNNNPSDDEGHGTHVSGIVLGTGQNIFASSVPLQNIEIMPLKFLDSTGSGSTSNAVSAIYYGANKGAKVMNNSWGGSSFSQSLQDAIAYAYSKDSVFVAAAGNSSANNDSTASYPASYSVPNVIAVAASDSYDNWASFSNYGKQTVPLSAPGVSVLSTYPVGQYAQMSGTSMASPFVAGTAALMRFANPAMNAYQIKQLILSSVDLKPNLASYVTTSGRVNVNNAVLAAQTTPVNSYEPAYSSGGDRGPSSSGCGLVSLVAAGGKNGPKASAQQTVVVFALLLLPLFLAIALRRPETGASRRRFERFAINSSVAFRIGDQELKGSVRTISVGGSELNTDALLKEGSIITMSISSPDGSSKIDVQGHIVWSTQTKRYGVAFDEVGEAMKTQIGQWTKGLTKV